MTISELSQQNQAIAKQIIEETGIIRIWENIGAEVRPVGSLQTGLLMKNCDIDFHIYTDNINISDSFAAIKELAQNPRIREIHYKNLIDTEEECIEWHVEYEHTENNRWKLDLIHVRKGSRYDGVVEKVTEAIREKLSPEIKDTILQIKFDMPEDIKIPGIDIYRAVFSGNVRSYPELVTWLNENPIENSLEWMP